MNLKKKPFMMMRRHMCAIKSDPRIFYEMRIIKFALNLSPKRPGAHVPMPMYIHLPDLNYLGRLTWHNSRPGVLISAGTEAPPPGQAGNLLQHISLI